MLYVHAFLAFAIFSAGFTASTAVHQSQIDALESVIVQANLESEHTLAMAKARVQQAEVESLHLSQQLETGNAQSLATINALHDQLHDGVTRGANAVPGCPRPSAPATAAEPADVSTALAELAYQADIVAAYAQSCWKFVSHDCGLSLTTQTGS